MTMIIAFGTCIAMNILFMEKYYVKDKREDVVIAYNNIVALVREVDIHTDDFDVNLRDICERFDIEAVILDVDASQITASSTSMKSADRMKQGLFEIISQEFYPGTQGRSSGRTILDEGTNYKIMLDTDSVTELQYLEVCGLVGDERSRDFVLARTTMESIRNNVSISNTFMAFTAFTALIIGGLLVLVISQKVTAHIKRLYRISDEMKQLNFEAKYESDEKYKNEIDILGQNMNELSETLETAIRDLKNANVALKQDIEHKEEIDAMRKEFLSNVSHELKTPIALIQGYAEGLKEGINDDAESRDFYCEVIMDEAAKMNIMVKKLLTLNQLEFGNENATMERFDIVEMVKNYVKSADLLAKQKDVTVMVGDYPPIYVWGDEFRIEEVLQNYYSNALNHIDGERKIEIKLTRMDNKVRVSVFNTGKPIPEDSIGHIWEKFYKVDKARTREYGGSGVGLSIVKAIMESMNQAYGVINYDNGVEFYFELETK